MNAKQIAQKTADFFRTVPVEKAWLFGSFSRGEATEESDIDILVKYDDNAKISLLYISHLIGVLENLLHRKVDLVEEGCLLPFAEETANRDKILIYERKIRPEQLWETIQTDIPELKPRIDQLISDYI